MPYYIKRIKHKPLYVSGVVPTGFFYVGSFVLLVFFWVTNSLDEDRIVNLVRHNSFGTFDILSYQLLTDSFKFCDFHSQECARQGFSEIYNLE